MSLIGWGTSTMMAQTLPQGTPTLDPHAQTAPRETTTPPAQLVAVVFTEHRYDTGAHKTWLFSQVHHVCICSGRVQLFRAGYGLILDVPVAEVEQVYTIEQGVSSQVAYSE